MMATLDELVKILMAWSDGNSTLAQEIARSGFVLLLTSILQTGTHLEVIPKVSDQIVHNSNSRISCKKNFFLKC